MSATPQLQWFPAVERTQKRITESSDLIMFFSGRFAVYMAFFFKCCIPVVSLFVFPLYSLTLSLDFSLFHPSSSLPLSPLSSLPLRYLSPPVSLRSPPALFSSASPHLSSSSRHSFTPLFISPPLHSFTWTGGGAAGLLHPRVRGGNHGGDVRGGGAVRHGARRRRPHPGSAEADGRRARPPGHPRRRLAGEHQGRLHHPHARLPLLPHGWVPRRRRRVKGVTFRRVYRNKHLGCCEGVISRLLFPSPGFRGCLVVPS